MADEDVKRCRRCNEFYVTCSISRNSGTGLCMDCVYVIEELNRTRGEEKKVIRFK
jgi:hypothetical protein